MPSKWIQFIEPQTTLPTALQCDPMSVLDSETEDLDLVRKCLEHFVALTSHELSSKQEQRERYQQVQCGRRTLFGCLVVAGTTNST